MMPDSRFSPVVFGGAGTMINTVAHPFDFQQTSNYKLFAGVGFEYMVKETFGLQLAFDNNYLLDDNIDNMAQGKYNDYYWRTRLGLVAYFGAR